MDTRNSDFIKVFEGFWNSYSSAKEIVECLYTNSIGFTKREISKKAKISEGGTLTNYLNGLLASDFIIKYAPFGYSKKVPYYKLVDPFYLFYLHFCQTNVENEFFSVRIFLAIN